MIYILSIKNKKSQSKGQYQADKSRGQIEGSTLVISLIAQGCVTQTQGVLDNQLSSILCPPMNINTSWIIWIISLTLHWSSVT